MRKWRYYLFFSLVLIGALFTGEYLVSSVSSLREKVVTLAVRATVKSASKTLFGRALQYEKMVVEEGRYTLIGPKLTSGDETLFIAQKIALDTQVSFMKRQIRCDLETTGAKFNIVPPVTKGDLSLKETMSRLLSREPSLFFKSQFHIRIPKGEVIWKDGKDAMQHATFDLIGESCEEHTKMSAHMHFKEGSIKVEAEHGEKTSIDLQFSHTPTSALSQLASRVGNELNGWKIEHGFIEGEARVTTAKKEKPTLLGKLTIEGLSLAHPAIEMEMEIPEINVHLKEAMPIEMQLIPTSVCDIEISKEATCRLLERGEPLWKVEHLLGKVITSKDSGLKLAIDGMASQGDETFQLHISGHDHTIDFALLQEGKEPTHISFTQKSHRTREIHFDQVTPTTFSLIRKGLSLPFAAIGDVHLEEGVVNATAEIHWEDEEISFCHIKECTANNLSLSLLENSWKLQSEYLTANLTFLPQSPHLLSTINGRFHLTGGACVWSAKKTNVLSQLSGEIVVKDGKMMSSALNAHILGMPGKMQCNFLSSNTPLIFHFEGVPKELARLYPSHSGIAPNLHQIPLQLLAKLVKDETEYTLLGALSFPSDRSAPVQFDLKFNKERILYGSFTAARLYLEEMVASDWQLKGAAQVSGTLDPSNLTLEYTLDKPEMEGERFVLAIEEANTCHFSFPFTKEWHGVIPIQKATLTDKNTHLTFHDIQATVQVDPSSVDVDNLAFHLEETFLRAHLHLDLSPEDFTLISYRFVPHTLSGNLQSILPKLGIKQALPLEGEVQLTGEDNWIEMQEGKIAAHIASELKNGKVSPYLHDLAMQMEYSHPSGALNLTNLAGKLTLPDNPEELLIAGDYLRILDTSANQVEFDFWIGDKLRDIIRIAGTTEPVRDLEGKERIQFQFSPYLTHVGNIHPDTLDLCLNSWQEVDQFNLDLKFQMESFLHDLKWIGRSGSTLLSKKLIQRLDQIQTGGGNMSVHLDYSRDTSLFNYQIMGEKIELDEWQFAKTQIVGKKRGNSWMVDQLQFDDFNFALDLAKEKECWKINFLGLRISDALLMGMEGKYTPLDEQMIGTIKLLEVDLQRLSQIPHLTSLQETLDPMGELRANGSVVLTALKGKKPKWQLSGDLTASLCAWGLKGLHFANSDSFHCKFHSDHGITFSKLHSHLLSKNVDLYFQKLSYLFAQKTCNISGLQFSLPAYEIPAVTQELMATYPSFGHAANLLPNIKTKGTLRGVLDIQFNSTEQRVVCRLAEDRYQLFGLDHHLKECKIEYDPTQLNVLAKYCWTPDFCILAFLHTDSAKMEEGELILTEEVGGEGMRCLWRWVDGLKIDQVEGQLAGLHADLINKNQLLTGSVSLDFNHAKQWFESDMQDQIDRWGLGQGFELVGDWSLSPTMEYSFDGRLKGNHFEFMGYRLGLLEADLMLSNGRFELQDLMTRDDSGTFKANFIKMERGANGWSVHLPKLVGNDFKPSFLSSSNPEEGSFPPALNISQMELNDLRGDLSHLSTLKGKGSLTFTNKAKKKTPNILFAIPSEMLTRIGLDLAVLTPVTGIIQYQIKEGKIYFTKFKDIYSEKHLSKFYLPNNFPTSYVDFDGNVNVQVKMKQYNLAFKFAELLTLNIQGTLANPHYIMQRQNRTTHVDKTI